MYIYGIYLDIYVNHWEIEPIQLIHNSFSINQKTFFEMTHFNLCISQNSFYIYITNTKPFSKFYSNFYSNK